MSEGYQRRPAAPAALRLDLNEAPWEVEEQLRQHLLGFLHKQEWRRYPSVDARPAREAAAKLYGWVPEGTLVGNGSNELLAAALASFAGNGQKVLCFSPSFSVYPWLVKRAGGQLVPFALVPPTFAIEGPPLVAAAKEADVLLLCSPNNPTGGELSDALWHQLLELGKPTIWDGAYWEFGRGGPVEPWLARYPNLVITRTLSKVWALAAFRAGCLLASPSMAERIQRRMLPFAPGLAVWAAFEAAASAPELGAGRAARVVAEREAQRDMLTRLPGVEVLPSCGNFFLLRVVGCHGQELVALLGQRGVAVREVEELSAEGYVRVTVGTPEEGARLWQALKEVTDGRACGSC